MKNFIKSISKFIFSTSSLFEGSKKYKVIRVLGLNIKFRVKYDKNLKQFIKNSKPKLFDNVVEPNRNKVYFSVCAVFKNEPDIIEWLNYHIIAGVERFYLYDNDSDSEYYDMLKPYIDKGLVVYKKFSGKCLQSVIYGDAVCRYKDETEWMAIIDVDEYLVPVETDDIKDFIKDYEDVPAVVANWVMFDSNGVKKRPKDKFVIETYTRTRRNYSHPDNLATKSIFKPNKVRYVDVHFSLYKNNELAVDENHNPNITSISCKTEKHSIKKIRINHYHCKSEEDYLTKLSRSAGFYIDDDNPRPFVKEALEYEDTTQDYVILKYLDRLKNFNLNDYQPR